MPCTAAPRALASAASSPLPQATSSNAVPSADPHRGEHGLPRGAREARRSARPARRPPPTTAVRTPPRRFPDHAPTVATPVPGPTAHPTALPRTSPHNRQRRPTASRAPARRAPTPRLAVAETGLGVAKRRLGVADAGTRRRGNGDSPSRSGGRDRAARPLRPLVRSDAGCAVRASPDRSADADLPDTGGARLASIVGSRFGYAQGASLPHGRPPGPSTGRHLWLDTAGAPPERASPWRPRSCAGPPPSPSPAARSSSSTARRPPPAPPRRPCSCPRTCAGRGPPVAALVEPVHRRAPRRRRRRPRQRRAPGRGAGRAHRPTPGAAPSPLTVGPGRLRHRHVGLGAVQPHVRAAAQFLGCRFGEPTMYGVAGRAGTSDHPSGRAVDFMVDPPPATGSPRAP